MNFNWPINPTTVNAGPIQIEIDGIPTTINIDTANPENSVLLPVKEYAFLGESALHDLPVDGSIDDTTPVALLTTTQVHTAIEVINTTGVPMVLLVGAVPVYLSNNGLARQNVYVPSGTAISIKCAQIITVTDGIVAINLFI